MSQRLLEALRKNPTPLKERVARDLEMLYAYRAVTPSSNGILTDESSDKAGTLLKARPGQLIAAIDLEVQQAGLTLAGYHVERGARTFAAYARAMLDDLGDIAKPYLKLWYMAVRHEPRMSDDIRSTMSSAAEVDAADVDAMSQISAELSLEPSEVRDD